MRMYAHELKALQTAVSKQDQQVKAAYINWDAAKTRLAAANREFESAKRAIDEAKAKLEADRLALARYTAPSAKQLIVTEHALLRYFERVLGYDLKKLSEMIASEPIRKASDMFPSGGTFPHDGFKVVVKDNTVVTVV